MVNQTSSHFLVDLLVVVGGSSLEARAKSVEGRRSDPDAALHTRSLSAHQAMHLLAGAGSSVLVRACAAGEAQAHRSKVVAADLVEEGAKVELQHTVLPALDDLVDRAE